MEQLKVLSLFSGIGAFEKALTNLGINYELIGFSEIDKYAIESYCAIHNVDKTRNLGDITKVNKEKLPSFDILVGGSPCQAFSVAGKRKGFEDTRGTLFFEFVETLKAKQPKYFLFENVKGLINHDKGKTLNIIAESFSEVGYRIDMELLNSKYFNVPQNRERIFIVGIREDLIPNEEWIIDRERNDVLTKGKKRLKKLNIKTFNFDWPPQTEVTTRLRDILEDKVDEKYYLSEEKTAKLVAKLSEDNRQKFSEVDNIRIVQLNGDRDNPGLSTNENEAYTVPANPMSDRGQLLQEPQMLGHIDLKGHDAIKRVYSTEGVAPTLTTMGGGHREPKIAIENPYHFPTPNDINNTLRTGGKGSLTAKHNYEHIAEPIEEVRPVLTPDRENKRKNGRRFKDDGEESFTLTVQDKHGVAVGKYPQYRIRKLTPLECYRLMGFNDEDFMKAKQVLIHTYYNGKDKADSQLYKQAGNSIVVNVLEEIFKNLFFYINKLY
ncbi:DNA (cytosine-5-)-methyltransferase [Bacillus smithii]|uniref:DNA (cytosine-5-)-methyltransferase n=1 Tax=Bacillus smithii TaxID=1479 RepID=UPI003D207018